MNCVAQPLCQIRGMYLIVICFCAHILPHIPPYFRDGVNAIFSLPLEAIQTPAIIKHCNRWNGLAPHSGDFGSLQSVLPAVPAPLVLDVNLARQLGPWPHQNAGTIYPQQVFGARCFCVCARARARVYVCVCLGVCVHVFVCVSCE